MSAPHREITRDRLAGPAERDAAELRRLAEANAAVTAAKQRHATAAEIEAAKSALHAAAVAARDAGIGWGRIGDTLGIRRGNAYQRYRKRASPLKRSTARFDQQFSRRD